MPHVEHIPEHDLFAVFLTREQAMHMFLLFGSLAGVHTIRSHTTSPIWNVFHNKYKFVHSRIYFQHKKSKVYGLSGGEVPDYICELASDEH